MSLKTTLIILGFFFGIGISVAQPLQNSITTEIYGRVIDATTPSKEPLPYVNIRLKGSGALNGTMTDPKGEYTIRSIGKVDSISFSFTGFKTVTVAVKKGKTQQLNIEMGSNVELDSVIVRAKRSRKRQIDTIASYVFYKIQQNKSKNRSESVNTYKYESYDKLQFALLNTPAKFINFWLFRPFKFVFDNVDSTESRQPFIPGLLKETVSDVYYRRSPKGIKKLVRADQFSGINNTSLGDFAEYHFAELDVYDNLLVIAGTSFVSPVASNGLGTYRYYVTDTVKIDGRVSYKFNFVGKVKEDEALKGSAWIDSATWAIRSITFRPNERANINFIQDYTIKQDFAFVNEKHWLMSREEMTTVGSLFKKKNKMSLLITKVHDRRNFETDIAIPDTIFSGLEEQVLDDSAHNMSLAYWDTSRFEPLSPQEKKVYNNVDTIKSLHAWKVYQSVGRFFSAAFIDCGPISIGRVLNFVSKNNVEGWRLRFGFETNLRFKTPGNPIHEFFHKFYLTTYGAYGLTDHDFKYQALMRVNLPRVNNRWQMIEAMYRYDIRVPGQDEKQTVLTFDNVLTLLSGRTLSKVMKVRESRFTYEKEWFRGLSTSFTFNPKTFYAIPGVYDFSRTQREVTHNIPNFSVTEFTFDSRFSHKDLYFSDIFFRFFLLTKYPVFMLRYTLAMVNMQGDYFTYHNFHFTIKQRLSSPIGHTNYTLRVGKILGKVPYISAYLTQGNLGILLDNLNYNLLKEFQFVSDQYASFWIDHHFEGFFFNKIPGFKKLKLREVIFLKSLIGSFSEKNWTVLNRPPSADPNSASYKKDLLSPGPIPYIEAGFGIENILYIARVDFIWRLTYRDKNLGPTWGIRLAINPGF